MTQCNFRSGVLAATLVSWISVVHGGTVPGFAASTPWTTWDIAYDYTLADVNGDGHADIIGRSGNDIQVGLSSETVPVGNKLLGYVAYEPGADFNRCVVDAGEVLNRLNARGDMLGFHYSSAGYTDLKGTDWHIQGIQRLPYYSRDPGLRGQFFVGTFSHPMDSSPDHSAHLGVARLDFKGGKDGKALGTNRAYEGIQLQ